MVSNMEGDPMAQLKWEDFERLATNELSFLENDYGFLIVRSEPPFILYTKQNIQLEIYWDINGRKEYDDGFKLLDQKSEFCPSLSLSTLMTKLGHESFAPPFRQVTSSAEAEEELKRTTDQLQRYLSMILEGDTSLLAN